MACRCRPDTAARSAAACRLGRSVSSQAAAWSSVGRSGRQAGGSPGGRLALGGGHQQDVSAGGERGVKVVVEKPPRRGVLLGWVVGGDQCSGVLTKQVMQEVAAGRRLGEQVMVIQLIEQPPCGAQISGDQRGGSVAVDGGARD